MSWKVLALLTPLLFVSYQALAKALPKDTPIFLINAYASLIGAAIMISLYFLTSNSKSLALTSKQMWAAIGIGALISLGNFGIIKAYSLGAPQSLFTILFYVALIIYGIIFGILFWNEKLNAVQGIGILLAILGLFMTVYFRK